MSGFFIEILSKSAHQLLGARRDEKGASIHFNSLPQLPLRGRPLLRDDVKKTGPKQQARFGLDFVPVGQKVFSGVFG